MVKPWLFLPFLGGEGKSKKKRRQSHPEQQIAKGQRPHTNGNGDSMDFELSRRATAKEDFAKKGEEEIVQDYNSPIHMWVVATLFPLIAGTFGPMASMFNICAIAINWRLIVNPDSALLYKIWSHAVDLLTSVQSEATGKHIPDPPWLIAVNVVSLVIAIIANISLLGQMTNRLRYNISGPITIVGFFISGFVDVSLVAAASQHLPLPDNAYATYSQAFYYAAMSGAIYVILSVMLSVTAWGIWFGRYSDEFKLSMSQRSLMLQTILFLAYVLCAGAVYQRIEHWGYLDANYFVVVTLFTIGFGDLVPTTHLGRSLFFPMAVGGILFVGVIIANIRTLVLESGSVKVSTRLVEKARFKAIQRGNPDEGVLKLRGVKRRETNAETELERRRNEFNVMREIQREAAQNNRFVSLAFSTVAFMILWFIGAVVFWKAESDSVGGQNWTYFESLYFTFVAQLTIGYGDFEPQTNSAKPAFVFWALIALPTLTVLIGAIGDVVADFVNWYTTWIGKHSHNIYIILQAVWERNNKVRDRLREVREQREQENDRGQMFDDIAHVEGRRTIPLEFPTASLTDVQVETAEETYRPFIILKAAQRILSHMDDDKPMKYTFNEWSWLLKLLGEDETDPKNHRLVGQPLPDGAEVVTPIREADHEIWSWLGQESPLMSLQEDSEPRWVLKRLMARLEQDLRARADKHIEEHIGPIPDAKQ